MSPRISPPHTLEAISSVSKISLTSRIQPTSSLSLGEKINVLVLHGSSGHDVLLQVKDSTLKANSPLPLQSGETLTVRVDQLVPTTILRIILPEDAAIVKSKELLRYYRSNPNALREAILSVQEMVNNKDLQGLQKLLPKEEIQNLARTLNKIIISKQNIANAYFIRDSLMALGMGDERKLYQAISNPEIMQNEKKSMTLKKALLKISSELFDTSTSMALSDQKQPTSNQMTRLVDQAMRVIESLQIVNILAKEQDRLFVLHLPFQFHEDIRMQDIYIESNRSNKGEQSGNKYHIVLFLDMDALGQMAVDAFCQDKTIHLTLKCSESSVCQFMQSLLQDLRKALTGNGYSVLGLHCIEDRNSQSLKSEFIGKHTLLSCNVIDVCA